jgi:hypothetical protein
VMVAKCSSPSIRLRETQSNQCRRIKENMIPFS